MGREVDWNTWIGNETGFGLLLNLDRSLVEQSCTNYVELTFEPGLPGFELGGALGEMINTPVNLVDTPVNLVETPINLVEALVDPPFHPIQGRHRHCCQSNTYGEDANKN